MIPDAEATIGTYLRNHADVEALDARVAGATPGTQTMPWVKVTQLDARNQPTSTPEHLIDYLLQFDCYAGKDAMDAHDGQAEASLLGRTVREALTELQGQTVADVVVPSVRFTGMARIPDQDFEPARERVVLSSVVHLHAV